MPIVFRLAGRIELPGTSTILALIVAFGLAWLADRCGSAMIIGAFAAGVLWWVATPQAHEIERGITARSVISSFRCSSSPSARRSN